MIIVVLSNVVLQEINHIAADLLKEDVCKDKLKDVTDVENVFYATWVNKGSEKESCVANAKMVRTEQSYKNDFFSISQRLFQISKCTCVFTIFRLENSSDMSDNVHARISLFFKSRMITITYICKIQISYQSPVLIWWVSQNWNCEVIVSSSLFFSDWESGW